MRKHDETFMSLWTDTNVIKAILNIFKSKINKQNVMCNNIVDGFINVYSWSWSMDIMLWDNVIELVMSDVGDKSSLCKYDRQTGREKMRNIEFG